MNFLDLDIIKFVVLEFESYALFCLN